MALVKLSDWFNERPIWLRNAAKRLLGNDALNDHDYEELTTLCLQEVENLCESTEYTLPENAFDNINAYKLKLVSISDVQGINALAPKVPLQFGKGNLAVVYGQNGAGKSGYVRILKHACGARHPGNLLPNAYSTESVQQQCSIDYEKNDVAFRQEWVASSGFLPDLKSVDIFDASCGNIYVVAENEVTYEPPVLSFFSELISVSEKISSRLDAEIGKRPSQKPNLRHIFNRALEKVEFFLRLLVSISLIGMKESCYGKEKRSYGFKASWKSLQKVPSISPS
jgi:energy-coupling factor transporter ATP-binding protein EcfA2